jgi:hypothetical protein
LRERRPREKLVVISGGVRRRMQFVAEADERVGRIVGGGDLGMIGLD